jgi:hypothetical protein
LYRGGRARKIYVIGTKGTQAPIDGAFLAVTERKPKVPTYAELVVEYQTKGEPTRMRDWRVPLNSISYGNSMFAGYWFDSELLAEAAGGACACDYLDAADLIGYALFINKKNIFAGKLDLFFISSLNTLVSMIAKGEFFHSRSRSFAPAEYLAQYQGQREKIELPGIAYPRESMLEPGKLIYFIDNASIFIPMGDPLEKAKELSEFISLNSTILKLPDSEGGFNATSKDIARYKQNQKDLTDMFKSMITIRKRIRKKEVQQHA